MAFSIADDRTLGSELDLRAERYPDKTWLTYEALDGSIETYSYAEFVKGTWRAARALRELGVQPGERILLHLGNCPEFLLLWFGAARLGAVIVPVNPLSSDPELEYLCQHASAGLWRLCATAWQFFATSSLHSAQLSGSIRAAGSTPSA